MDKDVIYMYITHTYTYTHAGVLLSHKNETLPFAATKMQLEIIILGEIRQKKERQIPCDITYTWSLKHGTNEPVYATETDSHREQTCGCQGGSRRRVNWELGVSR